ncbi:MAG: protein tyrosine phosphatase [Bacteroidetes bacterium 46-16]|nr:MAG: protein tyrosine phosphatase [Bacteroidetes bacterium 46-16]
MNILFVCSRNKKRSLTAETLFKDNGIHAVRSAGTESVARIRVSEKLYHWADLIFVMEKRHKERLEEKYGRLSGKRVIILDIPDEYEYMDEELTDMLRRVVLPYLKKADSGTT